MGHENKCAHLHGHNYVAYFRARAPLDKIGRVIDFSVLKAKLGGWIDEHWDHGFILHHKDEAGILALNMFNNVQKEVIQRQYHLPCNPTAENMAQYLLREICPFALQDTGVEVVHVRLWETENCYADASLPE